jgi:glycosyltransferase involved in cell wall biosynthesis
MSNTWFLGGSPHMKQVNEQHEGLRIALLTEGCYPFVTGGVSTWCGQLIRGLPEHSFEVVAITGGADEEPRLALPDNVVALRPVPLWGWTSPARKLHWPENERFDNHVRPFLESLVNPDAPQQQFDDGLKFLFHFARRGDLSSALRSRDVAKALGDIWSEHRIDPLTVFEVLAALELLEHSLRPLSTPPVRADICHAVSNGLPSMLALASKWAYGTPFVMSEHGVYLRERYLAFRELSCPWPVKFIILAFFRRLTHTAYAEADLIAPVNVYNQRWQVEHGADPDLIVTAFNGVEASDYPVTGTEPDVPTVAWVGRIDPLKDLITLVDGFAQLRLRIPDAKLRLFGPTPAGNEDYERAVRKRVAFRGLTDAVTFEGPISPVSAAYNSAHVVALSSISEGLPYTIIESMMCGRATVSTEVGGAPEVVGDTGLLVPVRNPSELASALELLLTNDELRRDMAARGRERAMTYFRVDQMLAVFRGIYGAVERSRDEILDVDYWAREVKT